MKFLLINSKPEEISSPPSRGAWIEITTLLQSDVAGICRPPRGGRGLKCLITSLKIPPRRVAPLAGGVD